jgi:hypothetical protein
MARGYYGRVISLIPYGNQEKDAEDFDVLAEMDQPCQFPYPADEQALKILAGDKELDLIMFTRKDIVDWSKASRLFTSFHLWMKGVGPALTLHQLAVLAALRVEALHQKVGRTCPMSSLTHVLMKNLGISREAADVMARGILGKTLLGGLPSEERKFVLMAMTEELTREISSTPRLPAKGKKPETAEDLLRRHNGAVKTILTILKQLAHIHGITIGMFSQDTRALVEAALSGCSEETMRVVRQLLKHKVPINPEGNVDEEGIASVVAFLCREIETLPLPKPAPAVPDVAAAPLVVKANSRIEALFADQRAANAAAAAAAEAAEATKDAEATLASQAKEAEYLLMIKTIKNAALIRAKELAKKQVELIQQRISTAETKLKNAEGRPKPKLKQGEDAKRLEEKKELQLKEIGAARSTLQQLRQELEDAETKLVYASAKAEEATKAAAEAKAATEAKAAGEAKAATSSQEE